MIYVVPTDIEKMPVEKKKIQPSNTDFVMTSTDNTMYNPHNLSMSFTKQVYKYKKSLDDMKNYTAKLLDTIFS